MSLIDRLFRDHPASVGETYGEHMAVASGVGFTMIGAGLACLVHAMMPVLFKTTGSSTIKALHARIVGGRDAKPAP